MISEYLIKNMYPKRTRDIMYMHIIEKKSKAEIGRHFGISRERVRVIINRVLENYKRILNK